MKRTITALFILLFAAAAAAQADTGAVENFTGNIFLDLNANVTIEGVPGVTGLEYQVDGLDRHGRPATGLYLGVKSAKGSNRFFIAKKRGSSGYSGVPSVHVKVSPDSNIFISKLKGTAHTLNMSGTIQGKIKGGTLKLTGCSGSVKLEGKSGNVNVQDHRAPMGRIFALKFKRGDAKIELGNVAKPGNGKIIIEKGRVDWSILKPIPVTFSGEVVEGQASCNLPLNQAEPNAIHFVGESGQAVWEVNIEKGAITVTLPQPGK